METRRKMIGNPTLKRTRRPISGYSTNSGKKVPAYYAHRYLRRSQTRTVILPETIISSSDQTFQQIMADARGDREMWAQPVRVAPSAKTLMKIRSDTDRIRYVAEISMAEAKTWGTDYVYADTKIRGVRALIYYNPETDELRVMSRLGNEFSEFKKAYGREIKKQLGNYKGAVFFDSELYATRKGYGLQQNKLNGFVHNPTDEIYEDVKPSFHLFDVLMWDGQDIRSKPLEYRKNLLLKEGIQTELLHPVNTKKIAINDVDKLADRIQEVTTHGAEGVVVKDPHQPYLHQKDGDIHWIKAKYFETVDLKLNEVQAYPDPDGKAKDPRFKFYKHWVMITRDKTNPLNINADKGMKGAGLDEAYYIDFTKHIFDQLDEKQACLHDLTCELSTDQLIATGRMLPVHPKFQKIYHRETVPEIIIYPKEAPIVELFVEDMTPQLKVSGAKIVGIRPDKSVADSKKDLKLIYNTFYKVS